MNLEALDLNLIKAFDALIREKTVTGAAKRIGLSQPAMSHALARLRHLFDDPLFLRTASGMKPTVRALDLSVEIAAALHHVRCALDVGRGFDPQLSRQAFCLGVTGYAEVALVRGLAQTFTTRAPRSDLRFTSINRHDLTVSLEEGRIVLGIGHFKEVAPGLNREVLFCEPLCVVTRPGHPLLNGECDLPRYAAQTHVLVSPSGDPKGAIDRDLEWRGLQRRIGLVVGNYLAVPLALRDSDMIAAVPARVGAVLQDTCGLIVSRLPIEHLVEEHMVWHRRDEGEPSHVWLRSLLREVAGRLP